MDVFSITERTAAMALLRARSGSTEASIPESVHNIRALMIWGPLYYTYSIGNYLGPYITTRFPDGCPRFRFRGLGFSPRCSGRNWSRTSQHPSSAPHVGT